MRVHRTGGPWWSASQARRPTRRNIWATGATHDQRQGRGRAQPARATALSRRGRHRPLDPVVVENLHVQVLQVRPVYESNRATSTRHDAVASWSAGSGAHRAVSGLPARADVRAVNARASRRNPATARRCEIACRRRQQRWVAHESRRRRAAPLPPTTSAPPSHYQRRVCSSTPGSRSGVLSTAQTVSCRRSGTSS